MKIATTHPKAKNEPKSRSTYVVVVSRLAGSLLLLSSNCTPEDQKAAGDLIGQGLVIAIGAAKIYSETQENAESTIGKTQEVPTVEKQVEPIFDGIKRAVQPLDSDVRTWAIACAKESPGPYHLFQAELIKAVTQKAWKYVDDPRGFEYFAKASESVHTLAGDCDDFAILLSSMVESIGGRTRIVIADGVQGDHAYVEVWIGSTREQAQAQLGTLKRTIDQQYHYRFDSLGYWANFDWFSLPGEIDLYTGGPYFVAQREFYVYVD